MKSKLLEHILSIVVVSSIFLFMMVQFQSQSRDVEMAADREIAPFLALDFIDYDNPLHRSLLKESMDAFYPGQESRHAELLQKIQDHRAREITAARQQDNSGKGLSAPRLWELFGMYLRFILAYGIVMFLTYYGVQTLGTLRFVQMKKGQTSYLAALVKHVNKCRGADSANWQDCAKTGATLFGKALAKGILYMILFSPAYVLAYSFKTRFDTDSLFFMVVLGVLSNGLLINYANKFYTFLVSESRKGYVQTAIVKNLRNSYLAEEGGIKLGEIFRLRKSFEGHVFHHIFINARYQYLSTIKEQASFLISGLVIIEMALNIHNHLCYELLQNILYQQYDVVVLIVLGIYLVLKTTEILADYWLYFESRRYENKAS